MRILKQTPQELVLCHRQIGQRLVAGCCIVVGLGAIVVASFAPDITCPGGKQTPSCALTHRSLTGLTLEREVQLKAARSNPICRSNRAGKYTCNGFTVTLITDAGDFSFHDGYLGGSNSISGRANQFIKDPSGASFQVQSPILGGGMNLIIGVIVAFLTMMRASAALRNEEIYIAKFNKPKDWVTVTRKKRSSRPPIAITEFSISAIQSVNSDQNHLALKLKSGREVQIATAVWGKKTIAEDPSGISSHSRSFWTVNHLIKNWLI